MYQINFQTPCHLYFVGIGGISMSGIAELLKTANFIISGSDLNRSDITTSLEKKGITVNHSQIASNITTDIDCVIFTSAIHSDNPEYIATIEQQIPHLSRAQLLGQLMKQYEIPICVSGTHGKTTTTSMIADILLHLDQDPTLSIGGILPSIGGNIRIGNRQLFVTEACEYTNSFLNFYPKIGIILNIEHDHTDFFPTLESVEASFRSFAELIPADGTLIINDEIKNQDALIDNLNCNVVRFGFSEGCDYRISNIKNTASGHSEFTLTTPDKKNYSIHPSVFGIHNITNGAAALTLAHILKLPIEAAIIGLENFNGTNRRFQLKGTLGDIHIYDDYAHHPTEIKVTLETAQQIPHDNLWCIFQPHTYTRTKEFLHDFAQSLCGADYIVLTDIYPARETDTLGMNSSLIKDELTKLGKMCYHFTSFDEIEDFILENCMNNDMLITMGAGDVVKIGERLLGQ